MRIARTQPSQLRRNASLRSYSSAPARKTYSDTRSVKSLRMREPGALPARLDPRWDT